MGSIPVKPPRFGLDKTPPLQLEFIDHGDDNARKRVRSHAMKDVQRRKRWDYARSTDHKRRNEERKRSAQANTDIMFEAEKRPVATRPDEPVPASQETTQSDHSEPDEYHAAHQPESMQPQARISPLHYQQNQYQRQPIYQETQIMQGFPLSHSIPSPTSLPVRSNQQQRPARSRRQGTPDSNSAPSLEDDESTTGSESRREYYNSLSPESDRWEENPTKATGTGIARDPMIADSDYEHGASTDSDIEEVVPKSLHERHTYPARFLVPNPRSLFSAARYDPFDALAKSVAPEDRSLVDHRIFVLPQLMFRVPSCCALSLVMAGPISFQASALAYSAAHMTRLQGQESRQAIVHKSTALRQLNEGVQTISLRSCLDVLYAILGLAMLEARFGNKGNAWLHMRGALQVIEKYRDDPAVNHNRDINFWVPWILITIEGYDPYALHRTFHDYPHFYAKPDSRALSMSSTQHQTIHNPSSIPLTLSDPSTVTYDAISEFLNFLRRIEHISLIHCTFPSRPPSPDFLFAVLELPPGAREGVRGASIQTTSRIASLIYINAALWELRQSPRLTDQFIRALKSQILDYKLGWGFSIEKLLHIMIEAEIELFIPGRSYFTSRMVNVAKRLGERSWDRVNDFLVNCLRMRFKGGNKSGRKDDSFLTWEDELRQELYDQPVTAHEYYPHND